jgi:hypothetical protein
MRVIVITSARFAAVSDWHLKTPGAPMTMATPNQAPPKPSADISIMQVELSRERTQPSGGNL